MAQRLNSDQKARLVPFAKAAEDFPLDRRAPDPPIDPVQRLLTTQYRINAWIENGAGHEQQFSLPSSLHEAFAADLAPKLTEQGFVVEYLEESIKVRYAKE